MDGLMELRSNSEIIRDEWTEQDYKAYLKDLEAGLKFLILENKVFYKYLERIESSAMPIIDKNLEAIQSRASKRYTTHTVTQKTSLPSSVSSRVSVLSDMSQPFVMSDIMSLLSTATSDSFGHRRAEYEESKLNMAELLDAYNLFEQAVVIDGVDPLTQRIPAEKFLKYMNEWIKLAQFITQKLILHINNEAMTFKKVRLALGTRKQLAQNIHAVDFDQLNIQNKNLLAKIDFKTKHVKELKKLNGWANVILHSQRHWLQSQISDMSSIKQLINEGNTRIEQLEKEAEVVEEEIEQAKQNYQKYKNLKQNFCVPDTMKYVTIKAELYDLEKNLKKAERQRKILNIALDASTTQMKHLCKTNKVRSEWFQYDKGSSYMLL
ncbi:coiled-coil domain-containing protein 113 isoform X2 [Aethina tumida]|uniref:coiled-coil domain-containing protein 113 isoform X2 n=1 Tax=Aethina tumida TaxID=116153 RepID=UPI0021475138|nr:coiled-coil domain-containing protein 113 isoform X2 [Aethina tumida]